MSLFSFRPALRHIDGQGILYHGHYFGFADEARTVLFRALGYPPSLWKKEALSFVVRMCQARYVHPIYFDDDITIRTQIVQWTPFRINVTQTFCNVVPTAFLEVQVVCVTAHGSLTSLPEKIQGALNVKFIASKRYHGVRK